MAKENNNKSFVLRIDAATMEALEGWAADEFRSMLRECGRMSRLPVVRVMPFLQNPRFRPGAIIPMICKLIL